MLQTFVTLNLCKQTDTKSRGASEIYDCLIVDEASKTTFQEFLVPAVFAKRWILVGDINQLSPYVETRDLEGNIQALIGNPEDAAVCVNVFNSFQNSRQSGKIRGLVVHNSKSANEYALQSQALGMQICRLSEIEEKESIPLNILGSHVLIIEDGDANSLNKYHDIIPQDASIVTEQSIPSILRSRHDYWLTHFGKNEQSLEIGEIGVEKWAQEIAWRLDRAFQKRKEGSEIYRDQISNSIPKWYPNDISENLELIKSLS